MPNHLRMLIDALAELFAAEGRTGGSVAAETLRRHRNDPIARPGSRTGRDEVVRSLCEADDALPAASLVKAAWDTLPWHNSGLSDGRIPEHIAIDMITCEILGSRGAIECDTCRVGLFAQIEGVDYAVREHAAEETFIMLAGQGEWRLLPENWRTLGPGEHTHHPSMMKHQSRSTNGAFLAAWRWTGDIGLESYAYKG